MGLFQWVVILRLVGRLPFAVYASGTGFAPLAYLFARGVAWAPRLTFVPGQDGPAIYEYYARLS